MDTISNNIVIDDLFRKVTEHGKMCIDQLEIIWRLIYGNTESIVADRYGIIEQHLKNLLDEMVKEEQESLDQYRQTLSELIACKQSLQEELNTTIDLPFEVDANKPNLCKQVRKLTEYVKKYETIKINRLQELISYKDMEEQLCDILGEEPKYASVSSVPSEEILSEIKTYIESLKAEKIERSNICLTLIVEIEQLIDDIELENIEPEILNVLLSRDERVVVSNVRIARLRELKAEFTSSKEHQIKEIDALREKTTLLWNLLDVSADERSQIINQTLKGCGQSVLNVWSRELERCEMLKALNIQTVIARLREVIKSLWEDCHLSEEERSIFSYFHSEKFDEDLLEAHEKEQQRLREYYDERKNIFALAKKWFALWEKMIVLENQQNNDTKRYANRGGQLLKEERERKAVQKELPNVEAKLKKLIGELEAKTQKPFVYDGRPLLELIDELWEQRRKEKENEKESRKIQSRGTPLKPNNNVLLTPVSSVQKRGKENASTSVKKPTPFARRELKMTTSTKKAIRRRSRSHDPCNRYQDEKEKQRSHEVLTDSSVGSYAGFQDYIENACKNGVTLRSSVSPPVTPSSRTDKDNKRRAFLFKTPTSVNRPLLTKKFGSSKLFRPMLY